MKKIFRIRRLASDTWDGMRFQPARTALSVMAVCVGMTALAILLSVMSGLRARSRALIEDMGANVFVIMPGKKTEVLDGDLTIRKRDALQASLPHTQVAAARIFNVPVARLDAPVRVFAGDSNYFQINNWSLQSGRLLDSADQSLAARSALVTATLADEANWHLGQTVFLGPHPFRIVGIVERPGSALEKETSDSSFVPNNSTLFIPLNAGVSWMTADALRSGRLDLIEIKVDRARMLAHTVDAARRVLAGRSGSDPYVWITPDSVLANVRKLEHVIGLTAGSVAFLCLILGGTTLMSLMVANIRDRIPEIALRRTLGATAADIALLFVTEACFVTVSASLMGLFIAWLLLLMAGGQVLLPVDLNAFVFLVPLITAVGLGIVFSYLPIRMAASVSPAEALRND